MTVGFYYGNQFVVLVHGFQKKTQETPQRDIITAEDIVAEHKTSRTFFCWKSRGLKTDKQADLNSFFTMPAMDNLTLDYI